MAKLHENKKGREDCADCPYPERHCSECLNMAIAVVKELDHQTKEIEQIADLKTEIELKDTAYVQLNSVLRDMQKEYADLKAENDRLKKQQYICHCDNCEMKRLEGGK